MVGSKEENENTVWIDVEISGEYNEIMDILSQQNDEYDDLAQLMEDVTILLNTIEQLDGGTRSRIADSLPETFSLDLSGEELVGILRVLEYYNLVRLDQNTWKPNTG